MRLDSIRIHPVKSTAIRRVDAAHVGAPGLVGDREWMVVDASGEMLSARTVPQLFRVVAEPTADRPPTHRTRGGATGVDPLDVARPDAARDLMSASSLQLGATARAARRPRAPTRGSAR